MHGMIIGVCVLLTLMGMNASALAESPSAGASIQERTPSGVVTGLEGSVLALSAGAGQPRTLRTGDVIKSGDELRVGSGSMIEVLWNKRALFMLRDQTVIRAPAPSGGQTLVEVLEGHVRIAYSYNEGHPTDTLAVMTPAARTVLRGGILEATVEPPKQAGDRHLAKFEPQENAREAGRGDLIRMVEGQARVEPLSSEMKAVLLKAGHELRVSSGAADAPRQFELGTRPRLAATAHHDGIPEAAVQRIADIHVDHALELEKNLRKTAEDAKNAEPSDAGVKGTILSTSLGIPLTPLQASSGGLGAGAAPGTSVVPSASGLGPPPAPTPPQIPSVQVPSIQIPAVVPSANQAGGINSATLLRDVLTNALDGARNGRGRGRGRD